MLNNQGRPTRRTTARRRDLHRQPRAGADEPLIFDQGGLDRTGVDIDEPDFATDRLGGPRAQGEDRSARPPEPETVRHYVRLSQKNYSPSTPACSRSARAR